MYITEQEVSVARPIVLSNGELMLVLIDGDSSTIFTFHTLVSKITQQDNRYATKLASGWTVAYHG